MSKECNITIFKIVKYGQCDTISIVWKHADVQNKTKHGREGYVHFRTTEGNKQDGGSIQTGLQNYKVLFLKTNLVQIWKKMLRLVDWLHGGRGSRCLHTSSLFFSACSNYLFFLNPLFSPPLLGCWVLHLPATKEPSFHSLLTYLCFLPNGAYPLVLPTFTYIFPVLIFTWTFPHRHSAFPSPPTPSTFYFYLWRWLPSPAPRLGLWQRPLP